MYEIRINRLRELLDTERLDAYFTQNPSNIYYLTGYRGDTGYLLVTQDEIILYTYPLFKVEAETQTHGKVKVKILKGEEIGREITEDLKHSKSVGVERKNISLYMFDLLYCHNQTKIRQVKDLVMVLRAQKEEREIEYIKKAQKITDEIFQYVLNHLKPDAITELELAAEMEYQMKKLGAEGYSFKTIVATGENSAIPHARPRNVLIKNNTNLLLDFGVYYNGYASDMTRTIYIGKADEEFKKVYTIVLNAQEKAEKSIKEGIKASEIDNIAREFIKNAGYGDFFVHGLGHGVGIDVHELPPVNSRSEYTLKKGMIITIEPGIYLKNRFGVRIEDMVIVEENGFRVITNSPKNLIEL